MPVKVRQYDRGQPCLVPVRHPVQEQRDAGPPLYPVVHRICFGVRYFFGHVIGSYLVLVDQAFQQIGQIVVERGSNPRPGQKREVVDPRQRLAEPEDRLGELLDGGIEPERSAILFDTGLAHDAFQHLPARSRQERIDVVVVADVHQGVAPIRQAYATGPRPRDVDGEAVAVGKLEMGVQHQRTIGTFRKPHVLAQPLAEKALQCTGIEIHRGNLGWSYDALSPAMLKSSSRQASAPSSVW